MNLMIERVAKAMAVEANDWSPVELAERWPMAEAIWLPLARVAIEAIREPDEEMLESTPGGDANYYEGWQAMIDKALKD